MFSMYHTYHQAKLCRSVEWHGHDDEVLLSIGSLSDVGWKTVVHHCRRGKTAIRAVRHVQLMVKSNS